MKLIYLAVTGLVILIACLLCWFADWQRWETEKRIRHAFMNVSGMLAMEKSTKFTLDELVNEAIAKGFQFRYVPNSRNPIPEFLPDYQYQICTSKAEAIDNVFMKAHVSYWFWTDVDITLFWSGQVSGLHYP